MIVVAEDHEDIRFVVQRALERAGHQVVTAADGAAALDAVRRYRPDVVVTDLEMPHMTGLDLCRAIRADEQLRHIPVVLASGSLLPDDERAAEVGASATLLKPFVPAQLLETVARLLPAAAATPATAATPAIVATVATPAIVGTVATPATAATATAATASA